MIIDIQCLCILNGASEGTVKNKICFILTLTLQKKSSILKRWLMFLKTCVLEQIGSHRYSLMILSYY